MLEHRHYPHRLVHDSTCLGELGVSGYELCQLVLDTLAPVLLDLHVEQLGRATEQIGVKRPSDAGILLARRVSLEAPRMLAG